jgi:thiosulfate dehydrogenase [quinone] large subunit
MGSASPGRVQEAALVVLRTLVGWHFLYEGYVKLWWPAWARDGWPLGRWSSAGYLKAAAGPLAPLFRGLADTSWLPAVDLLVAWGLVLVGLSLMLGLFTQTGCAGALLLLAMFYLSWIPTRGVIESGAEGNYLFVNKNLVEAGAVAVLMAFRTGRMAGLDLLLDRRRATGSTVGEATP